MYYLVLNVSSVILHITKSEPIKVDENDFTFIKLPDGNMIFDNGDYEIVAIDDIPTGMMPLKYCYSDDKFVVNPNYNDSSVSKEQVDYIEYFARELQQSLKALTVSKIETEIDIDYRLSLLELGLN